MKRPHIDSAWLTSLVAVASVAAMLVMWTALRRQEREHVEGVVNLATYSIRADMVADMDIRIRGLVDIAREWQIHEILSQEEFATRAAMYISHVPGCVAVGWVSPTYEVRWDVPVDGDVYLRQLINPEDPATQKALQEMRRSHGPIVMPVATLQGNVEYLPLWTPVYSNDGSQGFIVGVFRVQTLLDDILSDHAELGYEVVVSERNKKSFYSLTSTIPENQWAQQATVELPGREWQIRLWPGAKVIDDRLPLSGFVLLAGMVVSALLTLSVYLAQKARLWAENVNAANRELVKENAVRRSAEESLHQLSGRLLTLQDEERRRIARELHDSTAQVLYGLTLKLKLLAQAAETEHSTEHAALLESMELGDQCARDIRTIAYLLHPPSLDDLGLSAALHTLATGFTERSGIRATLEVPGEIGRLPSDVSTALFRVVQEALSNIHRHSGSKTARIRLERDADEILLEISDEGRGFPVQIMNQPGITGLGVGIAGMRERVRQLNGRLEITSGGNGTRIVVCLPLQQEKVVSAVA